MDPLWLALPGVIVWTAVLCLPWRPWSTREFLDSKPGHGVPDLSGLTLVIPARNESPHIAHTLRSAAGQGQGLRIILVDDQSTDATVAAARDASAPALTVVHGEALPAGWTGKLWALEQGRRRVQTPYTVLLDADIELKPGILATMLDHLERDQRGLVSLMAQLRMESAWERLLMPAFIFFFKLLYPFGLANSARAKVAAAAGGCIMIRSDILEQLGGFAPLRHELIDDCALARRVKQLGHRTWLGLTHSAVSRRRYTELADVWNMVARTAFTQLRYSLLLLGACTVLMTGAFIAPVAVLFHGAAGAAAAGILALVLMALSYFPTLRFYGLGAAWSATLPLAAALFLMMTWASAWRHWFGAGPQWKGRNYSRIERTRADPKNFMHG